MAIICPDYKLLFVMVPGTGCSVIGNLLQNDFGGRWLPEKDIIRDGRLIQSRKHNSVPQMLKSGHLTTEMRDDLLIFATIRNPFDRFVTYYQRLVGDWTDEYFAWTMRDLERERPNLSEQEYREKLAHRERMIQRKTRRQQIIRRAGFNNWLKVSLLRARLRRRALSGAVSTFRDHVFPMLAHVNVAMRYERLEDGLNEVLRAAGVSERVTLPHKNATPGKRPYTEYYSRSSRILMESLLRDELKTFGYDFNGPISADPTLHLSS